MIVIKGIALAFILVFMYFQIFKGGMIKPLFDSRKKSGHRSSKYRRKSSRKRSSRPKTEDPSQEVLNPLSTSR